MNRKPGTNNAKKRGFTLIEVCMVTVISGLLFLSLFELYSQYSRTKARDDTWAHIQAAASELSFFYNKQTRYPCPSDRTLKSTDPNFGVELGSNTATKKCDLSSAPINLIPNPMTPGWLGGCYTTGIGTVTPAGTNGVGGVCAFPCWAAPPNVAFPSTLCGDKTTADANIVVIGGLPFTTIRQVNGLDYNGRSIMFDGWSNQLDYVVTYRLTSKSTYQFNYGAITVLDENGSDTAGISNNGHYGLISHGPDGIGSYNGNGQMFQICGKHVPQSYNTGDDQNCKNESMFVAGIRNDSHTSKHYDDIVYFTTKTSAGLWGQDANSNLYNSNAGLVNVGTTTPPVTANTALNVGNDANVGNGNVHVDSTGVAKAAIICKKDGTDCFNIKAVTDPAGATITCPGGMIDAIWTDPPVPPSTVGVTHTDCKSLNGGVTFTAPAATQKCDATLPNQKWMVGIASDGKIICN